MMTPEDVSKLAEADLVRIAHPARITGWVRGRVVQLTENFIRVDWVDKHHSYDVLRRTSPVWQFISTEPK